MKKTEYVAALRELADFVEAHNFPDQITGWWGSEQRDTFTAPSLTFSLTDKADFGKVCSGLGSFEKTRTNYSTGAKVVLPSGVIVAATINRELVCRKIVTGTRIIPASERIIETVEEREEEIVEWECPESFIALGKTEETV